MVINFKGAEYTLIIVTDDIHILYDGKDITGDFSDDERYYIFINRYKLKVN